VRKEPARPQRVARRELLAPGRPAATVARIAGVSRQALYRRPKKPPRGHRRPFFADDQVILEVARANPSDGTRMVAALTGRELGWAVNPKQAKRLMASIGCCSATSLWAGASARGSSGSSGPISSGTWIPLVCCAPAHAPRKICHPSWAAFASVRSKLTVDATTIGHSGTVQRAGRRAPVGSPTVARSRQPLRWNRRRRACPRLPHGSHSGVGRLLGLFPVLDGVESVAVVVAESYGGDSTGAAGGVDP